MRKCLTIVMAGMLLFAGPLALYAQDVSASSQTVIPVEEEVAETGSSASPAVHPIDREVNGLLDKHLDTYGQVQALDRGAELWDAELNRVYKELMKAYGDNTKLKAELKTAQRAWMQFRDAEYKHLSEMYQLKDGTMYRIYQASDCMDMVKARALELKSRLDVFNDDK